MEFKQVTNEAHEHFFSPLLSLPMSINDENLFLSGVSGSEHWVFKIYQLCQGLF